MKKKILRRILSLGMALVLALGVPGINGITVSAKGDALQKDLFAEISSDSGNLKGIQGATVAGGYGGLAHTLFNVWLDAFVIPEESGQTQFGTPYKYKGETYYFTWNQNTGLLRDLKTCNDQGMTVSAAFLMRWDYVNNKSFLIDENAQVAGASTYYAVATGDTRGGKTMRALWRFILDTLEEQDLRIDNFILGNEVNMPGGWNYFGTTDRGYILDKYSAAFKDMYDAVREHSDTVRCSVCLDHSWADNNDGDGVGARWFLDDFDTIMKGYKIDDWCISAHMYPARLDWPAIWLPWNGMELNPIDEDARFVDGRNLRVMTKYVMEHFGKQHRIMLTENGFASDMGYDIQAASLAYTYYSAKYDPYGMVDCVIIHNEDEGAGLNFAIDGRTPTLDVWHYIDGFAAKVETEKEKWIADTCLPTIGVSEWKEIVPNYGNQIKYTPVSAPTPTPTPTPTPEPTPQVDYSPVFDADYYYEHNADIAEAVGKNDDDLKAHFIDYGMKEGRVASAEFDINAYKKYNQDLVAIFGEDNVKYYMHYIDFGKEEGRPAVEENEPAPSPDVTPKPTPDGQPVYRLYNQSSGEHLYTPDAVETQALSAIGWIYEGTAWYAPYTGVGVYRLYSPVTSVHLYTSDVNEVNILSSGPDWQLDNDENPLFYTCEGDTEGKIAIYRLYNEQERIHLLTTDLNEYNILGDRGWNKEGEKLSGWALGDPAAALP